VRRDLTCNHLRRLGRTDIGGSSKVIGSLDLFSTKGLGVKDNTAQKKKKRHTDMKKSVKRSILEEEARTL